jgi:signal transduction histidine kinase
MEALQEQREMLQSLADLSAEQLHWKPSMEIQTRIVDDTYLVRVSDNGAGISDDDLKKVLEPYYTTKFSGTGLGLAIVSRIVEEHGGSMEIASQAGTGTVITLKLPLDGKPIRLLEDSRESDSQESLE